METDYEWRMKRPKVKVRGMDIDPDKDFGVYLDALKYDFRKTSAEYKIMRYAIDKSGYITNQGNRIQMENKMFKVIDRINEVHDFLVGQKIYLEKPFKF